MSACGQAAAAGPMDSKGSSKCCSPPLFGVKVVFSAAFIVLLTLAQHAAAAKPTPSLSAEDADVDPLSSISPLPPPFPFSSLNTLVSSIPQAPSAASPPAIEKAKKKKKKKKQPPPSTNPASPKKISKKRRKPPPPPPTPLPPQPRPPQLPPPIPLVIRLPPGPPPPVTAKPPPSPPLPIIPNPFPPPPMPTSVSPSPPSAQLPSTSPPPSPSPRPPTPPPPLPPPPSPTSKPPPPPPFTVTIPPPPPSPSDDAPPTPLPRPAPKPKKPSPPPPPQPPFPPRPPRPPGQKPPPNFVVIITDDQDYVLNTTHPAYMPALNRLIGDKGIQFTNTISSTSVCCPARVSLYSGKLAHCTNVTANWFPAGAWGKFLRQKIDSSWLPGWLQGLGYRTMLTGKFINGFTPPAKGQESALNRCPYNWDLFDALQDGIYQYYDSSFSKNCKPEVNYNGQYQTDVIRDKALDAIREAVNIGVPFYYAITPVAPHVDNSVPGAGWLPPQPAKRHEDLYPDIPMPTNPSFTIRNKIIPFTYVDMSLPSQVKRMTEFYRDRLRALRAVDEMIESVVDLLTELEQMDNTYIIFASDNGLHLGQHGMDDGKGTNVEEDVRVPFFMAGPGIAPGQVSSYQANLVDLAPTIMALARAEVPEGLDGMVLPIPGLTDVQYDKAMTAAALSRAENPETIILNKPANWQREMNILEAWDSDAKNYRFVGITFKSVRLCTTYNAFNAPNTPQPVPGPLVVAGGNIRCYKYSTWCKGPRELYDLSADPFEIDNRNKTTSAPKTFTDRLDVLMSVLVHCSGTDCQNPYAAVHPQGDVLTFQQAMDPRYDELYASKQRFVFNSCQGYYYTANEPTWTLGLPGFPSLPGNQTAG